MSSSMYRHAPKIERRAESAAPAKKKRRTTKPKPKAEAAKRKAPKNASKKAARPKPEREPRNWSPLVRRLGTVALAVTLIVGGYFAWTAVAASDRLSVRTIDVVGAKRSERAALFAHAGIRIGQPILEVDLDGASQAMRRHPWVAEATVTRAFPDRLTLNVIEHTPAALVTLEGLYLVNRDGEVFKRWSAGDPRDFPVITGFARDAITKAPALTELRLQVAIALFEELEGWSDTLGRVDEVHWDEALGWSAVTRPGAASEEPVQLALGFEPHGRVALAARSLIELERRSLSPAVVWADGRKRSNRVHARLRAEAQSSQVESEVRQ
ncbi:MAG: FtsQ-type POTRA domain-containing protein [Myxococcota bacterium]